jgi:hypothetical protein
LWFIGCCRCVLNRHIFLQAYTDLLMTNFS